MRLSATSSSRWVKAVELVCASGLVLSAFIGCEPNVRIIHDDWANFPRDPKPIDRDGSTQANQGYAILLKQFQGPKRQQRMFEFIRELREQTDLADIWTRSANRQSAVYFGRFSRPDSFRANTALDTARQTSLDGELAFVDSRLVAISGNRGRQQTSPNDLRQFAGRPGMRTLEVAIFTPDRPNYRAAAEQRATELRNRGEKAFFYHGPNYSSVTIGLFTQDDFQTVNKTQTYGPRINALQEKFPNLHVNGDKRLHYKDKPDAGYEPTKIVRVPTF